MKVDVFRSTGLNSRMAKIATIEMPAEHLPRQGDYLHLEFFDEAYGLIVSHVIWRYRTGDLISVEIIT